MLVGMNPTELVPRPAPATDPDYVFGSPACIAAHAQKLLATIHAGSVDADSFGENVTIALTAMGLSIPPLFAGMIGNAVRAAYESPASA